MKTRDFYYELPQELIAQYPLPNRCDSRLMVYHRNLDRCEHRQFDALSDYLEPGDLLVMNNSKVIPARLYGRKSSGGKVELLVERITTERSFLAHIKASKSPRAGTTIVLDNDKVIEVLEKKNNLYLCQAAEPVEKLLQAIGHIPLPLYITRTEENADINRYQTVYALHNGSVAAPTAGLHFDEALLQRLQAKGVGIGYVTLHVGAGTFQPVRADNIQEHTMHSEYFQVSESLCEQVNSTIAANKRVVAVGTTTLRSLESAAHQGRLQSCSRETNIFIYPGYRFQICSGLITNFHVPESTLLMLVAAFIGHEKTMELYQLAVQERYRFFSYGDASLLLA